MAPTAPSSSAAKFAHAFSGISVWLEPDPSQTSLLVKEMEHMRQRCGGVEAGMHELVPHCTLLYNTSFPNVDRCSLQNKSDVKSQRQQGVELLRRCLELYRSRRNDCTSPSSSEMSCNTANLKLRPTSHFYFPYPKSADNGKGFGCAISLLILETTPELSALHDVVKRVFPPDERHSGASEGSDGNSNAEGVKFQPHVALVYAPEGHESVLSGWLEERTKQLENEKRYLQWTSNANGTAAEAAWDAKYLSVWLTEGPLEEWYPIAKVDLLSP
ncbi:hypothetical protein ACHAXT_008560 [Thalassiosira profunda]